MYEPDPKPQSMMLLASLGWKPHAFSEGSAVLFLNVHIYVLNDITRHVPSLLHTGRILSLIKEVTAPFHLFCYFGSNSLPLPIQNFLCSCIFFDTCSHVQIIYLAFD